MKRKILAFVMCMVLTTSALTACGSKNNDNPAPKTDTIVQPDKDSNSDKSSENNDSKDSSDSNGKTEEENQIGQGVNGDIPSPSYTYEDIVNGPVGLCPGPHQKRGYSVSQWVNITNEWRSNMQSEVAKIEKHLTDDATDEEIDHFFNQLLYIVGSDYSAVEDINRFGYVIFKKDMKDPFTGEKVNENKQVNVEIVLDASGSMAKQINGQTMMNIAKNSITEVLKHLPKNAKVGLRVFGHKGNNTDSGKTESCSANELIHPIEALNTSAISKALSSVEATGWTSIADSIKNGGEDLSKFKEEGAVNILYIVTDGIETCGGDPIEAAQTLKNSGTNVVLGIIGFNVNATQDAVLKKIAEAGGGQYAIANDAGTLTSELYKITEATNNTYNWEPLTQVNLNLLTSWHNSSLFYNKMAFSGSETDEHSALSDAVRYAENEKIISYGVYKKLQAKIEERRDKIKQILGEEYAKREAESKKYLDEIKSRKGEQIALFTTTSRVNPHSDYYVSATGIGGNIEDSKKDGDKLNADKEESMKNDKK